MKVLVTGIAGFIGFHTAEALLRRGDSVVGIDNLNDYYDPRLKRDRLARLQPWISAGKLRFEQLDLADTRGIAELFARERFQRVVHLAAQAGVRYSLTNPGVYAQSNLLGFLSVLEGCRHQRVEHLVYASSSSVYGGNSKTPFSERDAVDHPVSLYAATKKANELMAHTYSHLYALPATGLRFFTVYGPWARPDMAPMLFARAILCGEPIRVFNFGKMKRDFTYVDDIVTNVVAVLDKPPLGTSSTPHAGVSADTSWAPYRIFNIGRSEPVELLHFIEVLERALGRRAVMDLQPLQAGDMVETSADSSQLEQWTGAKPAIDIEQGVQRFVAWYRGYYKV